LEHVIKKGKVTRGYLGVSVQEATPTLARALNVAAERGIVVVDVAPDSPAARAGLKRGDVITAADAMPVDDVGRFRNLIAEKPPGARVKLTFVREKDQQQTVEAEIAELRDRAPVAGSPSDGPPGPLGLSVADPTPEDARRLGLPPGARGPAGAAVTPA